MDPREIIAAIERLAPEAPATADRLLSAIMADTTELDRLAEQIGAPGGFAAALDAAAAAIEAAG